MMPNLKAEKCVRNYLLGKGETIVIDVDLLRRVKAEKEKVLKS